MWFTLMLATFACVFPWTVGSPVAVWSISHFPFTKSGLMRGWIAPVSIVNIFYLPYMYLHAVRLLLFWCTASTCSLVLTRFSLTGTPAKMVCSSPLYYYLMVRQTMIFFVVPCSFFGNGYPFHPLKHLGLLFRPFSSEACFAISLILVKRYSSSSTISIFRTLPAVGLENCLLRRTYL